MSEIQIPCTLKNKLLEFSDQEKTKYVAELTTMFVNIQVKAWSYGVTNEKKISDLEFQIEAIEVILFELQEDDEFLNHVFVEAEAMSRCFNISSTIEAGIERVINHLYGSDIIFNLFRINCTAFIASKGFMKKDLTSEEEYLLEKLRNGCIVDCKKIIQRKFSILKTIFTF